MVARSAIIEFIFPFILLIIVLASIIIVLALKAKTAIAYYLRIAIIKYIYRMAGG